MLFSRTLRLIFHLSATLLGTTLLHTALADSTTAAGQIGQAEVIKGQGTGSISTEKGIYTLRAQVLGMQEYVENNKFPAAVFDFHLSEPLVLPETSDRVSFQADIEGEKVADAEAMFRVIIRDARGGEWAVGTRFGGGLNAVQPTKGFELMETYEWKVSELGRIDSWVMTSLNPEKFDDYSAPQAPLSVVGFRLVVKKGTKYEIAIRDLQNITKGVAPNPYWWVANDATYMTRKNTQPGGFVRYGWAPQNPQPYLKAADFSLVNGTYDYTWEILSCDETSTLASGAGKFQVNSLAEPFKWPLLKPGAYLLRIFTRGQNDKTGDDKLFQYVVVRNDGAAEKKETTGVKPLRCDFDPRGKNVFEPGSPIIAQIVSKSAGTIQWNVESSDRKKLLNGESTIADNGELKIDLTGVAQKNQMLWLSASLLKDGIEIDTLRRMVGYKNDESVGAPALGGAATKLNPLRSVFRRTRSDAGISALTYIVANHDQVMALMNPWFDEAKMVGYNIVEIWVPWFDLAPLPGICQYDYLDQEVQEAKKRGLYVVLRLTPSADLAPSWVTPEYQENQYLVAQGAWSGQSQKLWSLASPSLRTNYFGFLKQLATHYKSDPKVLGYAMDDIFCDHGMLDEPDLGQHMDYSTSMHSYYVKYLQAEYCNSLKKLSQAHHRIYQNWQEVVIPSLDPEFDDKGRLVPCASQEGLDFAACKRQVVENFRTDGNAALRAGDPACIVGPYADTCLDFDSRTYAETKCFVPEGSMEEQFPVEPHAYIARSEPIAYIEGSIIADVGITNIAFHKFAWNEFNNYWFPQRTIETAPPLLKESELRLKKWFSVLDLMKGVQESSEGKEEKVPLVIGSLETLIYTWKTTFTSRMADSVAPFLFQGGKEKVRARFVFSGEVTPQLLEGCPYVYLPYASDTLDPRLRNILKQYVSEGGKLVMEWSSGYWAVGQKGGNVLGADFGLPDVSPIEVAQPSVIAEVNPQSLLGNVGLAFRTKEFSPPIEDQPVAWIHTIPRCYFRLCSIDGSLPKDAVTVAELNGKPVAYLTSYGKGKVLFFGGTIDWLASPGLVSQVNAWGTNHLGAPPEVSDPDLLVSNYSRGLYRFALGRRFINHTLISSILGEHIPEECKVKKILSVPILADVKSKYSVEELLSGAQLGQFDGAALRSGAVSLPLGLGEGFVLQATPVQ